MSGSRRAGRARRVGRMRRASSRRVRRVGRWRFGAAASLLGLQTACVVGTLARDHPVARSASGVFVELSVQLAGDRAQYGGELLAIDDESLLILYRGRDLLRIERGAVSSLRVPSWSGRRPADLGSEGWREQLRLLSRYPQGVSAELEERLLDAYGGELQLIP